MGEFFSNDFNVLKQNLYMFFFFVPKSKKTDNTD